MQQQSQIFVFSTQLANQGAEAVNNGLFSSIIAYHCSQPATKKILEKHPLKVAQFNRQNQAQWLQGMVMMKGNNKPGSRSNLMQDKPMSMSNLQFPGNEENSNPNSSEPDLIGSSWGENRNLEGLSNGGVSPIRQSQTQRPPGSNHLSPTQNLMNVSIDAKSPSNVNQDLVNHINMNPIQPSLQGVKVPDEDLTPQQRQHRQEALANLVRMRQMLFPDQQPGSIPPQGQQGVIPSGGLPNECIPELKMRGNPHHLMNRGGMIPCGEEPGMGPGGHPGMHNPPGMVMGGMGMNQMNSCGVMQQQKMPMGMMNPGGPAQTEWSKLQNQYYEGKGKMMPEMNNAGFHNMQLMHPNSRQHPPNPMRSNSGPRAQGPPPPYHQTQRSASVPIATQSPNPSSPNNPTSNLSLPSPRGGGTGGGSSLNSPAQSSGAPFKNLGQSPTSQDSPMPQQQQQQQRNSLTHSNPSTPLSAHMSPNASLKEFEGSGVGSMQSQQKELNLMPVPSPQQIQYLNTFEGQELTIQKQPNVSVKDGTPQSQ